MGLVSLLFSFKGRICRRQYWLWNTAVGFVSGILTQVLLLSAGSSVMAFEKNPAGALQSGIAFCLSFSLVMFVMSWCSLALQVKRFHDRGQSGWWAAAPFLPTILLLSTIVTAVIESWPPARVGQELMPALLAFLAIGFVFLINLGFLGSQDGPNKYGDPPSSGGRPLAPTPAPGAKPAAATANGLLSAQSAIDRAIAEQANGAKLAPQAASRPRTGTAPLTPAPAGGAPSFGRRTR